MADDVDLTKFNGFEWDDANREKNWIKHKVTWEESMEVFFNKPHFVQKDERHSQQEDRFSILGITNSGRRLAIVFTRRDSSIRIITARDQSKRERLYFETLRRKGGTI